MSVGDAASKGKRSVPSPPSEFFDVPREFGPYYLLLEIGKGSFGTAVLGVLRRDFRNVSSSTTCAQLYCLASRYYVIKRFRSSPDPDNIPTLYDSERIGKTAEQIAAEEKKMLEERLETMKNMFVEERNRVAKLKLQIEQQQDSCLVQYIGDLEDCESGTPAMVFEYCNFGDIRQMLSRCQDAEGKITPLSTSEFLWIAKQLAFALRTMHIQGFLHRDLALRNVFVDVKDGVPMIKLGDFGFCCSLDEGPPPTELVKFGSLHEPPGVNASHPYDEKGDIYGLGIMFYELLTGADLSRKTLYALNTTTINAARSRAEFKQELAKADQSDRAVLNQLICKMIDDEPANRPSAQQVFDALIELSDSGYLGRGMLPPLLRILTRIIVSSGGDFRLPLITIGHVSPSECTARGPGLRMCASASEIASRFTVQACDRLGQPIKKTDLRFDVEIKAPGDVKVTKEDIKDNSDGTYTVEYQTTTDSKYLVISVSLNSSPIKGSPFKVNMLHQSLHIAAKGAVRIAVSDDKLFVSYQHRIDVHEPDGALACTWGREGTRQGEFKFISGLAVGRDGELLVLDAELLRVQVFKPDGGFIREWSVTDNLLPTALAVNPNRTANEVLVLDECSHSCQVYSSDGNLLRQWQPSERKNILKFKRPRSVAVDSGGRVFIVADNHFAEEFDQKGASKRMFPFSHGSYVDLAFDTDLAALCNCAGYDHAGIYVFDTNAVEQKFQVKENLRHYQEVAYVKIKWPRRVALSSTGAIYVLTADGVFVFGSPVLNRL